ncbi:Fumarylacetoacetate (FAA) hydrolase family protein [Planctomycetes bacterium Pan216]|uniref:Fumarylacetoacetate (FAA) hydrolase family protein n=1 Tax=Kolteria novifilia TaxID=2527975 RepID=A0A518BAZ5_9BACT|nr:Fumarylacetoacetate (FAA) hydrolase family protein [Planctomycetes bacterium Pan216]
MQLCRFRGPSNAARVGLIEGDHVQMLAEDAGTLSSILAKPDLTAFLKEASVSATTARPLGDTQLLAPIDDQEVWAAGVTYKRSQTARMEESEQAASFYDRVYSAERPEIFFKATPHRVVGPGQAVRVRQDTAWTVPEPELALVLSPKLEIVGYTVGNDMSARDIEGENPLYLPQAKMYSQCAALGPVITLVDQMPNIADTSIVLEIKRDGAEAFRGETSTSQINRSLEGLVDWLGRDNSFPNGAFLMTGTGIVPPDDFSLCPGDEVLITIDGIGTLANPVVQG